MPDAHQYAEALTTFAKSQPVKRYRGELTTRAGRTVVGHGETPEAARRDAETILLNGDVVGWNEPDGVGFLDELKRRLR